MVKVCILMGLLSNAVAGQTKQDTATGNRTALPALKVMIVVLE